MAQKSIAWTTGSGKITLTYTGQGNGTIAVDSDPNTLGTARSQTITVKTTEGGIKTKNITINQAACPFPVGDVRNYNYTGSYQEVELPAGQYKLQCWGAQGGSNEADSTYSIIANAGGRGGYAEGIITLSQKTTVRVYVGGQGGASGSGGWNGGGATYGHVASDSNTFIREGRSAGGGGATDIRLSDGNLLSRMIVAGGGSGGAMCYYGTKTTEPVITETIPGNQITGDGGYWTKAEKKWRSVSFYQMHNILVTGHRGETCTIKKGATPIEYTFLKNTNLSPSDGDALEYATGYSTTETHSDTDVVVTVPSDAGILSIWTNDRSVGIYDPQYVEFSTEQTVITPENVSQAGYAGGGISGDGYSDDFKGKKNGAGTLASFGQGGENYGAHYVFASGGGGGGWYGGGAYYSTDIEATRKSGGGSGWVNVSADVSYRPSGYTGLQLDSGTITAGNQSFEAPGGGTETGHEGNGYARITRLS